MNYSESDDQIKRQFTEIINSRLSQLVELGNHWANKSVQYLFVTTGGSLVAILGYFGSSPTNITPKLIIASVCLAVAVIGVGVLTVAVYFRILYITSFFRRDIKSFIEDKLSWELLHLQDESRSGNPYFEILLGLLVFAVFVVGIGFASYGMYEIFGTIKRCECP